MEDIKAKKVKSINEKTLIVAMDIGKWVHHAYFRAPNGREMKSFPFSNSRDSFENMWTRICQFKAQQGLEEVVVGFESTGPYAEPMCHFLSKKPVRLVQVNPVHTKRLKELTGNSPNKSDQKDPRVIADIISLGHALSLVVPEGPTAQLRRLTQARERAMKRRIALSNQLQHLMFVIFPEFLALMKDLSCKSAIYLIKNYPTPESIVGLGLEGLTMQLKRVSRGKLGRERQERRSGPLSTLSGLKKADKVSFWRLNMLCLNWERILSLLLVWRNRWSIIWSRPHGAAVFCRSRGSGE